MRFISWLVVGVSMSLLAACVADVEADSAEEAEQTEGLDLAAEKDVQRSASVACIMPRTVENRNAQASCIGDGGSYNCATNQSSGACQCFCQYGR